MRNYGKVFCSFWDARIIKSLSDQGKLLASYLLTSQHTTLIGCFRLPIGYIQEDLHTWTRETVSSAFVELTRIGFVTVDEDTSWVLIHRYLIWNPIENPNQGKQAARLFEKIPTSVSVKPILAGMLVKFGRFMPPEFQDEADTVTKPFLNQYQDKEKDQNHYKETTNTVASLPASVAIDSEGSRNDSVDLPSSGSHSSRPASPRASIRGKNLEIAELAMPIDMAEAWARVKKAWPRIGYDPQKCREAPRFTNPARAGSSFKLICDEAPIELAGGQRLSPENLADATLAWLEKKQQEAPGGRYPVVPCIENFFSCEPTSKLHWQSALLAQFGTSEGK